MPYRIPAQVVQMLGALPDGTLVVRIPAVYAYLTRDEVVNRIQYGNKTVYHWKCDRNDEREFVTFNYGQLINQIIRHKAAHVKQDIRPMVARQAQQVRRQPAPRPAFGTQRRPFLSVYGPTRRPQLPP